MPRRPRSSTSSAAGSSDLDLLTAAAAADPRDEGVRLALVDHIQEHHPHLRAELERWEAGTLRPGAWNRRFLPEYFAKLAPADFHHRFDDDLHRLHTRRGSRLSYIAPRGGAKSTWNTLAYPLRCALEGWEPYTLILSDSTEQAAELLGHIKTELETNEQLAAVYRDSAGVGPEWSGGRIRLRNGALIQALGTGKKARGRRNRSARPSLIIFDDIQSNKDITSPTYRARAWQWATREVIPAGDERTNYISVGSALHAEACSVRFAILPGWIARTFPAVHGWPTRVDLWDRYVQLACDGSGDDKAERAAAFLAANSDEMHRGARSYWPERWTLAQLMLQRAAMGANGFLGEYQGVPATLEGAEWPGEYFPDTDAFWFDEWPGGALLKVLALDPSKGTDGKGTDYQSQVWIGVYVVDQRYVFLVDADLDRLGVVAMCERTAALVQRFNAAGGPRPVDSVVCEENGTMGLLQPALDAACVRTGVVIPYLLRTATDPKAFRIRAQVGPPLSRAQLRFRRTPGSRMLVEQLKSFPFADHDDGPDALATGLRRVAELLSGAK